MRNFWDIDEFLQTEEMVSCTTERNIKGMAFLDERSEKEDDIIRENKIVKVPLWICMALIQDDTVRINEPIYLSESFYKQLITDSVIVNLKSKNKYFYDMCIYLVPRINLQNDWASLIWKSAFERFLFLYISTLNDSSENDIQMKKLCYRERELYRSLLENQEKYRSFVEYYIMTNKKKYRNKRKANR